MIVMKFGGTSVGSVDAMRQVADIAAHYRTEQPVLVVSALSGVTDALHEIIEERERGGNGEQIVRVLIERHIAALTEIGKDDEVYDTILSLGEELRRCVESCACGTRLNTEQRDELISFGERMSAPLVAHALRERGERSAHVDSRDFLVTDDFFGSANVHRTNTKKNAVRNIFPLVDDGVIPVVTGYIGRSESGKTTTLGRGGSDLSAAVIADALDARELWIWKEVDGIMTADPRIVPEARLLSMISYDEAAEMSYYGAKVLHPKTMIPVMRTGIPIRMRNTFAPNHPGTLISKQSDSSICGVKVVTTIMKLAMVTVSGRGMLGVVGFAGNVFAVAGREKINITMFSQSSSEQNICLIVSADDADRLKNALVQELGNGIDGGGECLVTVAKGVAAIAVVGEGMCGMRGVASKLFTAVADAEANILAIAQGSSEKNISFIVDENEAVACVRSIHHAFALHNEEIMA